MPWSIYHRFKKTMTNTQNLLQNKGLWPKLGSSWATSNRPPTLTSDSSRVTQLQFLSSLLQFIYILHCTTGLYFPFVSYVFVFLPTMPLWLGQQTYLVLLPLFSSILWACHPLSEIVWAPHPTMNEFMLVISTSSYEAHLSTFRGSSLQ